MKYAMQPINNIEIYFDIIGNSERIPINRFTLSSIGKETQFVTEILEMYLLSFRSFVSYRRSIDASTEEIPKLIGQCSQMYSHGGAGSVKNSDEYE